MDKHGWTYKKLGEVCDLYQPKTLSSNMLTPNGKYAVYGANGIIGRYDNYNHEFSEVLMTCRGATCGTINISEPYSWINGNAMVVHPQNENLSKSYLVYVLRGIDLSDVITGAAQPQITRQSLSPKRIPVPPLAEQERIVAELDLLSCIIEKKKAQLQEYDQLGQSIFYDMFGSIKEDTPLSTYISALGGGKSLAGKEECKNKVLKTGAVTYDYFNGNEVKNLPIDYQPQQEHLLKDGDILISRMNTLEYVGACAYVWKAPPNTYLPDRLWRATLKDNINPIFLWFSLIQNNAKEQIRTMASGTSGSMKNISIPRFLSIRIKCIRLSLQQEFAEKIEAIEKQKALVQASIAETETLFNSRMDYYFG